MVTWIKRTENMCIGLCKNQFSTVFERQETRNHFFLIITAAIFRMEMCRKVKQSYHTCNLSQLEAPVTIDTRSYYTNTIAKWITRTYWSNPSSCMSYFLSTSLTSWRRSFILLFLQKRSSKPNLRHVRFLPRETGRYHAHRTSFLPNRIRH